MRGGLSAHDELPGAHAPERKQHRNELRDPLCKLHDETGKNKTAQTRQVWV